MGGDSLPEHQSSVGAYGDEERSGGPAGDRPHFDALPRQVTVGDVGLKHRADSRTDERRVHLRMNLDLRGRDGVTPGVDAAIDPEPRVAARERPIGKTRLRVAVRPETGLEAQAHAPSSPQHAGDAGHGVMPVHVVVVVDREQRAERRAAVERLAEVVRDVQRSSCAHERRPRAALSFEPNATTGRAFGPRPAERGACRETRHGVAEPRVDADTGVCALDAVVVKEVRRVLVPGPDERRPGGAPRLGSNVGEVVGPDARGQLADVARPPAIAVDAVSRRERQPVRDEAERVRA